MNAYSSEKLRVVIHVSDLGSVPTLISVSCKISIFIAHRIRFLQGENLVEINKRTTSLFLRLREQIKKQPLQCAHLPAAPFLGH